MILFLFFQFGWSQSELTTSWSSQLNQLESTASNLKRQLEELNGYFSVSNHGNIPVLSIEDSMIEIEFEIQALENQIKVLKHP